MMMQKFEMSMMGELNYFLGFQVKQLKDDTFISQIKYTQDLLKRFGMKDAKPAKTPMGTDRHVDLNKGGKSIDQKAYCRRFDPGGSLDRRVNCRRVPQPRWVGARRSAKGGNQREIGVKGKPAAFMLSRAQVGCACSRGLQASAWEGTRGLHAPSRPPRAANPLVRVPWAFLL